MQRILVILLSMVFVFRTGTTGYAQITLDSTVLDTTTIFSGLDVPWEIQLSPDNKLWVTERYGMVSRIDPESGQQDTLLDLSGVVYQSQESGLLGMVLHPDFEDTAHVFMVYTYLAGNDIKERLVRYTFDGSTLTDEQILLDDIRGFTTHDGSRLIITPDRKLLMTTGDAQVQPSAQDLSDLSGKLLRLNLDGSIPADNPIPGSYIYSWGHRNAQGLYLGPNGILYSSEHGPTTDDEFNIIYAKRNYGWPTVHGFCDSPPEQAFCSDSNVVEPLVNWTPTIAPSDIVYYDHPAIPEWRGSILMTVLKDKQLIQLQLNEAGDQVTGQVEMFTDFWGRLRDICVDKNGTVYLATNGASWFNTDPFTHKIIRLKNNDYSPISGLGKPDVYKGYIIYVYPNPVAEQIHITVPEQFLGEQFTILDINGKIMSRKHIMDTRITIKRNELPTGVYFLIAGDGKDQISQKVILK